MPWIQEYQRRDKRSLKKHHSKHRGKTIDIRSRKSIQSKALCIVLPDTLDIPQTVSGKSAS
jgi:hypothetical protein